MGTGIRTSASYKFCGIGQTYVLIGTESEGVNRDAGIMSRVLERLPQSPCQEIGLAGKLNRTKVNCCSERFLLCVSPGFAIG